MINLTRLKAARKGGGEGAINYLFATEYYLDKDGNANETMRWGGKGAMELGLIGKTVDKATMTKLGEGFAPDGTPLCKNAGEQPQEFIKLNHKGEPIVDEATGEPIKILKGGHRIGFDMTISAPKDVSTAYALADLQGKEEILRAHRIAAQAALDYVESKVETRRGKGGINVIETKGLVYSQHEHLSSRNLDPQLHTHNLIYGVAQGADGEWGTFDAKEMYAHARAADEIYKMKLYHEMQRLGFHTEQVKELNDFGGETGKVITRIQGVSEELIAHFSSRREELLAYQAEHGVDAQTACLATRKNKDEPTFTEMTQMWTQVIQGFDPSLIKSIEEIKAVNKKDENYKKATNEEILERLHLNDAIFTEKDLMRELAMENAGRVDSKYLPQLVEQFKKEMNLVEIRPEGIAEEDKGITLAKRHTQVRYAAPWMVNVEQEIRFLSEQRAGEEQHHVPDETLQAIIKKYEAEKGFQLSDEQKDAAAHICRNTGGIAVMSGLAGTGKTTIAELYKSGFESQGFQLKGIAVSNAAAQKLEAESGMPSMSVAQLLVDYKKGQVQFTNKDVIVLDEAGMVDAKDTLALMRIAKEAGAKLILQGDTKQLQPIGAGSGMQLAEDMIGATELTEIRRQKDKQFLNISYLFYGKNGVEDALKRSKDEVQSRREIMEQGKPVLDSLIKKDALDEWNTKEQAIKALVKEYMESEAPMKERLALAHSRVEVDAINEGIRAGLKEQGLLGDKEAVVKTRQGDKWQELGFARGDQIRFNTKNKELGVVNGTQGVLEDIHKSRKGGFNFTVRKADGKKVKFNTHDFNALSHDYCMTVHKSQGQGKTDVFHLANTGMMDNQSSLVAFTRLTKGKYRLFATTDEVETLHERFGMERLKENATTNPNPPTKKERVMKDLENWLDTAGNKDTQFLNQVEVMVQAKKKKAFKPKNVEVNATAQTEAKKPVEPVAKDKPSQSQFRR